jgi:hypothetical protein
MRLVVGAVRLAFLSASLTALACAGVKQNPGNLDAGTGAAGTIGATGVGGNPGAGGNAVITGAAGVLGASGSTGTGGTGVCTPNVSCTPPVRPVLRQDRQRMPRRIDRVRQQLSRRLDL